MAQLRISCAQSKGSTTPSETKRTPESMAALLKTETERWGRYVKLAKIEPQ